MEAAILERVEQRNREDALHIYLTDCLKAIAENTARMFGGVSPSVRYADAVFPQEKETRTPDEIIASIRAKL